MPNKPLRPCKHPGCRTLTSGGYCEMHRPKEAARMTASQRGYTAQWSRESKAYLQQHPWCIECARQGRATPATEVDHIVPHKGNRELFWDQSNWQGLCKRCHSIKTAREDGGFGNPSPYPALPPFSPSPPLGKIRIGDGKTARIPRREKNSPP